MNTHPSPTRSVRPVHLLVSALVALPALPAQTPPTQLAPVITTATRTPADAQTLGSVVEVISAADLARRQVTSLSGALGGASGTPLFASGAGGAVASLFMRGSNSNQTLFLVDGIRLNDPNTDYNVFLGGACVSFCDSLEIGHGPQSTLYGGEAMGGVVSLRAQPGAGAPSHRLFVEGGSFGTLQGAASTQGERGPTAWNFSAQGGSTQNERANNDFESANVTSRVDHKLSATTTIGGTVRYFYGLYGDPGSRFANDPDNFERENNTLATAFLNTQFAPGWDGRFVLGGQDRRFVAVVPRTGFPTTSTIVKNRRGVLDAQTTYTGTERHRVTGGITAEANHTVNTGFGAINEKQGLFAAFIQDEFSPTDSLFFTGGLRSDDFDTFGRATTGRATVAWLPTPKTLKVRATYGTAFRSPSFLDLYGQSAFYTGNPNLRPEKGKGWDGGFDWYLPNNRGTFSVTWFRTDYTNLIASTPSFTSVENIQKARTEGLEFTFQTTLPGAIELRGTFDYLEADNLTNNTRLLRRPRQKFSLDVFRDFGGRMNVGVGATHVANRRDVNASTFAQIDAEDYLVVRVYSSWQMTSGLALKLRVENALDEQYEEVHGYPALGVGAFAGLEWKF